MRLKNKFFIPLVLVLVTAIGAGLYFVYKQNLGSTDSSAGSNPKLVLLSSSVSKTSVAKGASFTVKCNYQIPYSVETKRFDGISAAKETAKGIYVMGDGITCTKNTLSNPSEPGNVSFTCKSNTEGIYSVGCGIKQGTQTVRLVDGRSTEVCTTTEGQVEGKKEVSPETCRFPGDCDCAKYPVWDPAQKKNVEKTRCFIKTTSTTSNKDCKKYVRNEPIPTTIDYLNSYKVIDYVKVGNPTGSANCAKPVYINSNIPRTNVNKTLEGTAGQSGYAYDATCIYAIKGTHLTSSVKVTADKATCATPTSSTTTYNGYTIGNQDIMSAKCTPKSGLTVNTKITSKCNFVAGTVNGVSICGRTDNIKDVVTVVKN